MANDALELAQRFAPILYFHPKERFFPSDAKRYIELCGLWKAVPPFDSKASWTRLIEQAGIAASDASGEVQPGDEYLGKTVHPGVPGAPTTQPYLVNTATEEHFLELAGWRVPTGFPDGGVPTQYPQHEAGVTPTTINRYADRSEAAYRYGPSGDQELLDSRFWYHAEYFDTERLRNLMTSQPPGLARVRPDLSTVFVKLEPRHPALLCYYFFFPGHDESLGPPCDASYTGQEFASFAGEWACLALLLFRPDPNDVAAFQPAYVGYTGRLNYATQYAMDPERRIGMTVDQWKSWQNAAGQFVPETIDDHPKLFVAQGTHSLYLEAGQYTVTAYPGDSYPQQCGAFDGPDALEQSRQSKSPPDKQDKTAAVFKMIGGLLLGGIPGFVVGMVAAGLEGNFPWGIDAVGTYDPASKPEPDATAIPGALGKIVHPQGLTLTDRDAEFVPWAVSDGAAVGSRHYTFIVDRKTQVFWPGDDGTSGYRGRWGPRVAIDPFNRRAGMRFPEFWRMFFIGLAGSSPTEFQ